MKEQVKATAILVGYIRECAMSGKPDDPAREFADLLAQVTSTNKKIRDAAKSRIKEIARKGGWDPDYGKTKEIDRIGTEQRPRHVDPKFPNRGKGGKNLMRKSCPCTGMRGEPLIQSSRI